MEIYQCDYGGRREKGNGAKEFEAGSSRTTHSRTLWVTNTRYLGFREAEDRQGSRKKKVAAGVRERKFWSNGVFTGVYPTEECWGGSVACYPGIEEQVLLNSKKAFRWRITFPGEKL